eukprot:756749-Hanusia_phi.AAC.4
MGGEESGRQERREQGEGDQSAKDEDEEENARRGEQEDARRGEERGGEEEHVPSEVIRSLISRLKVSSETLDHAALQHLRDLERLCSPAHGRQRERPVDWEPAEARQDLQEMIAMDETFLTAVRTLLQQSSCQHVTQAMRLLQVLMFNNSKVQKFLVEKQVVGLIEHQISECREGSKQLSFFRFLFLLEDHLSQSSIDKVLPSVIDQLQSQDHNLQHLSALLILKLLLASNSPALSDAWELPARYVMLFQLSRHQPVKVAAVTAIRRILSLNEERLRRLDSSPLLSLLSRETFLPSLMQLLTRCPDESLLVASIELLSDVPPVSQRGAACCQEGARERHRFARRDLYPRPCHPLDVSGGEDSRGGEEACPCDVSRAEAAAIGELVLVPHCRCACSRRRQSLPFAGPIAPSLLPSQQLPHWRLASSTGVLAGQQARRFAAVRAPLLLLAGIHAGGDQQPPQVRHVPSAPLLCARQPLAHHRDPPRLPRRAAAATPQGGRVASGGATESGAG